MTDDAFLDLYRLLPTRESEGAAYDRDVFGVHDDLAVEVTGDDVPGFEIQHLTERHRRAADQRRQLDFRVLEFLSQAHSPAAIVIVAVALHAGIEDFPHRLDHRVRHRQMELARTALELDRKRCDDDDFRR